MRPRLLILIGSTREGRRGEMVARWFESIAAQREDLTCELVDLREWALPMLPFPRPPGAGDYADPLQRRWADKVAEGDAYVLVTPEYNHGYPASLKNALDWVYAEWRRKPVGYVSYGGPAGGLRAVQQLRLVAVELDQVPMRRQVFIPRTRTAFGEDGRPTDEFHATSAERMLDDLAWWARALAPARAA